MAKVAKKTWPWPGFTRPHFPGKLGQKPGKRGLARLCQAGRVFDRAPDARVVNLVQSSVGWKDGLNRFPSYDISIKITGK